MSLPLHCLHCGRPYRLKMRAQELSRHSINLPRENNYPHPEVSWPLVNSHFCLSNDEPEWDNARRHLALGVGRDLVDYNGDDDAATWRLSGMNLVFRLQIQSPSYRYYG